jgi:hypothetical protein
MCIPRVARDHHRRGPSHHQHLRNTILAVVTTKSPILVVVTTMSLSPTIQAVVTIMVPSPTTPMSIQHLGRILTSSPSLNPRHTGTSLSLNPSHTGTRPSLNPHPARVPSRRVQRLPTAVRVPREAREPSQSQKARRRHTPSRRWYILTVGENRGRLRVQSIQHITQPRIGCLLGFLPSHFGVPVLRKFKTLIQLDFLFYCTFY